MHWDQRAVAQMLDQLRKSILKKMALGKKNIMENEGKAVLGSGLETGDCSHLHMTSHINLCYMASCRELLSQVDVARERLRGGAYGFCAQCGDFIGIRRLHFLPFAIHCRDCQEDIERCGSPCSIRFAVGT